ncbi:hypothetical protein M0P98_09025 [bacterium]|nr:hypothetical protein [bacterium]
MILPIYLKEKHPFVELDGNLWLFDTGSPYSFGDKENISIDGIKFQLPSNFPIPIGSFGTETIVKHVGVNCVGLIGMDVIGKFDHIIDIGKNQLTISKNELEYTGKEVRLSNIMNVPAFTASIANKEYTMLFDTGAQISFFLNNSIVDFPYVGKFTDFFPTYGKFETDTYTVEVELNGVTFKLLSGNYLPEELSKIIKSFKVDGFVGSEMLINRVVGFTPRRNVMYI